MSSDPASLEVNEAQSREAAVRSMVYSFLARSLCVPDEEFHSLLISGELASLLSEMLSALPYSLKLPEINNPGLPDFIFFQSEYIAFFDVGAKGPPCPLYEGAIRKERGRKAVWEDLLRFYSHFGVKMSDEVRELPDQLSAELEFMHYLAFLEVRAGKEKAGSRQDLVRAQRDFLERHLAAWTPELSRRSQKGAPPIYCALLAFLHEFISADLSYLKESAAC